MGRTSQKKVQIEHRRTQVTELYMKCWTQAAIAGELGVSQATISSDLKANCKELRESRVRNSDEAIAEQLKKLLVLSREAWDGWKRSQEPAETTRIIQKNGEKRAEKTVRQQTGDPGFLRILLNISERYSKLLGLDGAASAANEQANEEENHKKAMGMFWDLVADPPSRDAYDDPIERKIAEVEKE
jgi:predicted transcriptional regulator